MSYIVQLLRLRYAQGNQGPITPVIYSTIAIA